MPLSETDLARAYLLRREQTLARPIRDVFTFFANAANLERITPPWLRFRIITPTPVDLQAGTLIHYVIHWQRLPLGWTTRIELWQPPTCFVDMQLRGPYRIWHHTHHFESIPGGTGVTDEIRYHLPFGVIGRCLHRGSVRHDLERIFDHRAATIMQLLGAPPESESQ